jgi:hypothetical protein
MNRPWREASGAATAPSTSSMQTTTSFERPCPISRIVHSALISPPFRGRRVETPAYDAAGRPQLPRASAHAPPPSAPRRWLQVLRRRHTRSPLPSSLTLWELVRLSDDSDATPTAAPPSRCERSFTRVIANANEGSLDVSRVGVVASEDAHLTCAMHLHPTRRLRSTHSTLHRIARAIRTPRSAALAGIAFSILLTVALVLVDEARQVRGPVAPYPLAEELRESRWEGPTSSIVGGRDRRGREGVRPRRAWVCAAAAPRNPSHLSSPVGPQEELEGRTLASDRFHQGEPRASPVRWAASE